jgi:hypothetical protein
VVARLHKLGLDVDGCAVEGGGGHRVVFQPDGRLALTLGKDRVEVALELPSRDLDGARARLGDPGRALELTTAIEALPEQFTMGTGGGGVADGRDAQGDRVPVTRASTDDIRALLDRVERVQRPLWLGWSVPRAVALAHAATLDEQLEDALVALGEVLDLFTQPQPSPSPSHELHGVHPGAQGARRDRREHTRGDDDSPGSKRRARARARDREREQDGVPSRSGSPLSVAREHEAEPEAASEREAGPPRLHRAASANASANLKKMPLRAGHRRRPLASGVDPRAPVEKGGRVRVLDGPFAGKTGVVHDLDGKGGARVMLGLLAVRIDVKDLVACAAGAAQGRPMLSSSHRRKPLPVRS